jgi:hypothetical protein
MNKYELAVFTEIGNAFNITVSEGFSFEAGKDLLADKINQLINLNFAQLVNILYRLDISEAKLKEVLKENPTEDAGQLIAQLIIERQLQKLKARQQFNQSGNNTSDEEKW